MSTMTETASLLSGDQYMELLQQRMNEWLASHPAANPKFPPLLTWFVQDGDEELVDPSILEPAPPQPEPERQPRYYRPASYWRGEVERLESAIAPLTEPLIPDRAAAGGVALGPKRTARIQRREDSRLRRYCELKPKLDHAQSMLRAAEARETASEKGNCDA